MKPLYKIGIVAIIFLIASCKKDSVAPGNGSQNPPNGSQKKVFAKAGPDQVIVLPNKTVVLDGSGSYDSTGAPLNYSWQAHLSPSVSIINGTTSIATAVMTIPAKYKFILNVWNNNGASADTVEVILKDQCEVTGIVVPQLLHLSTVPETFDWETPKIYSAGKKLIIPKDWEYDYLSETNPISIYDVETHTWIKRHLPTNRSGSAVIVSGNKVFFAGGAMNPENLLNSITDVVEIYDVTTDTWLTTHLSEPRRNIKAAIAGNTVVFAGGLKNGDIPTKTVDIYNLLTGQWSVSALQGPAREVGAAVSIQNFIYFCGGITGMQTLSSAYVPSGASKIIDIYNSITGTWSLDSMSVPRIMFTAVAANEKIYLAGGIDMSSGYPANFDNNNFLSNLELKSLNSSIFQNFCLSRKLAMSTSAKQGDNVIFFSGWNDMSGKFDIYNTINDSWTVASVSNGYLWQSSIVALNDELYGVGIHNGITQIFKLFL